MYTDQHIEGEVYDREKRKNMGRKRAAGNGEHIHDFETRQTLAQAITKEI